jgi:hypothetical protein
VLIVASLGGVLGCVSGEERFTFQNIGMAGGSVLIVIPELFPNGVLLFRYEP